LILKIRVVFDVFVFNFIFLILLVIFVIADFTTIEVNGHEHSIDPLEQREEEQYLGSDLV
jgi:hypothetical protein